MLKISCKRRDPNAERARLCALKTVADKYVECDQKNQRSNSQ